MGLLSLGTPLDWHESKKYNEHVRENGIVQLINIHRQHDGRQNDKFYWGDEVEYMLVDVNDGNRSARLSIDSDYILSDLNDEAKSLNKAMEHNISFHPEYGRYMIEATPAKPYDGDNLVDYAYVEQNMEKRRMVSNGELPSNIKALTLTTFPRMGCKAFTSPPAKPIGSASQSLFLPDEIINRHVRFPTLTANIRKRKGCKVCINLPMYPDKHTLLLDDSIPKRELFPVDQEPLIGASKPGHVYMDSMGFGMGASCLQVTMQAQDINEARYLYDSLAALSPIMLSLTAAAPIFKGFLVNQDVRWNVISGAVDDRTFIERGTDPYPGYSDFGGLDVEEHLRATRTEKINEFGDYAGLDVKGDGSIKRIPKSRYDSICHYLGDGSYGTSYYKSRYNDTNSPYNKKVYDTLLQTGRFDHDLAKHYAYLFIRDPLVLFSERINQNNDLENDHFENIQSTNWQTLRFKPPALYGPHAELKETPGWRVEFRPMEIQLTDFENAAYSVFITLLSKAILKFKPDFYIPLSKVDESMGTAHKVDSAINDKFWFRSPSEWNLDLHQFKGYDLTWFDRFMNEGNDCLMEGSVYINGYSNGTDRTADTEEALLSLDYLFNGSPAFPGLISLVVKLIAEDLVPKNARHCNSDALHKKLLRLKHYLLLVSQRASGRTPTIAHWLRHNVLSSPLYHRDSKVSDELNYCLIKDAMAISDLSDPALLHEYFGHDIASYLLVSSAVI